METANVLIVGGGPGGLSAAIALARRGFRCELVEISDTGAPVGAAITITARAVDALEEIGVLRELEEIAGDTGPLGNGAVDVDGAPLRPPDFTGDDAPRARGRTLGMYRPLMSAILTRHAQAQGVRVRLGTTVEALDDDGHGVSVTMSDGTSGRYDLVVAADGIRSKVRSMVFDDAPAPEYAGQCIIRWMAPGPRVPHPSGTYHGSFGKLLSYPLPKQQMTYVALVCSGEHGIRVDPDEARALLASALDEIRTPYAKELRRRLSQNAEVLWRPFEWLLIPAPWYRGRTLLIGDAAHATTAHMSSGGGMAIEDGVVLAQEMAAGATVPEALAAFMDRRIERVRAVVETSLRCSLMENEGAPPLGGKRQQRRRAPHAAHPLLAARAWEASTAAKPDIALRHASQQGTSMDRMVTTDDGVRLYVRDDGRADQPPLLLANGLGTGIDMWERQLPVLTARCNVVRYDVRGHGRSDVPPGDYSIARLGRDALAIADALGWERFDFCGLSMGAMTGFWIAIHAPNRLKRLIAANGAPFAGGAATWTTRIAQVESEGVAAMASSIVPRWFTPAFAAENSELVAAMANTVRTTPQAGYLGCCAAIRDMDLRDGLSRIAAATLLIGATHDQTPFPDVVRGLGTAIPGARVVILDAAHMSNIEDEARFNEELLSFLM